MKQTLDLFVRPIVKAGTRKIGLVKKVYVTTTNSRCGNSLVLLYADDIGDSEIDGELITILNRNVEEEAVVVLEATDRFDSCEGRHCVGRDQIWRVVS